MFALLIVSMGQIRSHLLCRPNIRNLLSVLALSFLIAVPEVTHSASLISKSRAAQLLAASCALLLVVTHAERFMDMMQHPIDPPKHFVLPPGAGKTRESFAVLLARARGSRVQENGVGESGFRPLLPAYEIAIRYEMEEYPIDSIKDSVRRIARDKEHEVGYIVSAGHVAKYQLDRVDHHQFKFNIFDFDGRVISSGVMTDELVSN